MNIEKGWCFSTADFSLQASGRSKFGSVSLVRDIENKKKWLLLSEEVRESESCPELYIYATGETIEEAIINANLRAAHTKAV